MSDTLNRKIKNLTTLVQKSQDKRLLWEEMKLISQKAFTLQDEIMAELDKTEALETDIVKIQAAFTARESIWDLMEQITNREQELQERTHHKETPTERAKRHREVLEEAHQESCCCGHHHEGCCCGHHADEPSHHKACSRKKGKTCKTSKK